MTRSTDQPGVVAHETANGVVSGPAYLADDEPPPLSPRLKRRRLPVATLVLALLAVGAVGFVVGVKVEKTKLPASNTAATAAARLAAGGLGTGATGGAGRTTGANATPNAAPSGAAGGAGAVPGGPTSAAGAANIIGTVTVVDGSTLYVTDTAGDTVKVTTNSGTTISKTTTGTVKDLAPGQSVVIRGVQSAAGVYAAQTVTQGAAGGFGGGFGGGGFGGGRAGRTGPTAAPTAAAGNG
jgi:hypothetical protein